MIYLLSMQQLISLDMMHCLMCCFFTFYLTWAAYSDPQVHAQLKLLPDSLNGYIYTLVTLLCGALLGVIFYGWGVWA